MILSKKLLILKTDNQHSRALKIKTWLFNPFIHIAGMKALLAGLFIMSVTGMTGYYSNTNFDGVIDIHISYVDDIIKYIIELIIPWLLVSFFMYISGRIFSKSQIRFVDVFGTQALARAPFFLASFLGFVPAFQHLTIYSTEIFLLGIIMIIIIAWSVTLMYNAYRITINIKGERAVISFIIVLVLSEVIAKFLIFKCMMLRL
jgi:hypothetical protein